MGCSGDEHSTTACHFGAAALATAYADRPHVGEARILEAWDAGGDDAAAAAFLVLPDGLHGLQAFEDVDIVLLYADLKMLASSRD